MKPPSCRSARIRPDGEDPPSFGRFLLDVESAVPRPAHSWKCAEQLQRIGGLIRGVQRLRRMQRERLHHTRL